MLNPGGYAVVTDIDGRKTECDTITCSHCCRVVFVPVGKLWEMTGGCHQCGPGKFICLPCVDVGICTPFERVMEAAESQERFARSVLGG